MKKILIYPVFLILALLFFLTPIFSSVYASGEEETSASVFEPESSEVDESVDTEATLHAPLPGYNRGLSISHDSDDTEIDLNIVSAGTANNQDTEVTRADLIIRKPVSLKSRFVEGTFRAGSRGRNFGLESSRPFYLSTDLHEAVDQHVTLGLNTVSEFNSPEYNCSVRYGIEIEHNKFDEVKNEAIPVQVNLSKYLTPGFIANRKSREVLRGNIEIEGEIKLNKSMSLFGKTRLAMSLDEPLDFRLECSVGGECEIPGLEGFKFRSGVNYFINTSNKNGIINGLNERDLWYDFGIVKEY